MYFCLSVCTLVLVCVCVCVLSVHQLLGNHLLVPPEGVISDSQCVKSQYWQSPQHSLCVRLCVCAFLSVQLQCTIVFREILCS